jgi:hypothetical protein
LDTEALRYESKGRGSIPDIISGIFHLHNVTGFRPHYGPEVDSACNRNEHKGYLLGLQLAGA